MTTDEFPPPVQSPPPVMPPLPEEFCNCDRPPTVVNGSIILKICPSHPQGRPARKPGA